MLREPSLIDINEKLQKMAEKLMNGDVCKDEESTKLEINRANSLIGIANTVVSLYEVDNQKRETDLRMSKVADNLGYDYVPKEIIDSDIEFRKRKQHLLESSENE